MQCVVARRQSEEPREHGASYISSGGPAYGLRRPLSQTDLHFAHHMWVESEPVATETTVGFLVETP